VGRVLGRTHTVLSTLDSRMLILVDIEKPMTGSDMALIDAVY
jgi:hypothetical protein